jgi:hypothetical protein
MQCAAFEHPHTTETTAMNHPQMTALKVVGRFDMAASLASQAAQ